jgi:hypothetical protein
VKSFKLLAKTDLQTVMLYCRATCKRTVRNYAALPGKCDVFYAHSLYSTCINAIVTILYFRTKVVYVYTCSVRVHVHFVTVVRKYGNRIPW